MIDHRHSKVDIDKITITVCSEYSVEKLKHCLLTIDLFNTMKSKNLLIFFNNDYLLALYERIEMILTFFIPSSID